MRTMWRKISGDYRVVPWAKLVDSFMWYFHYFSFGRNSFVLAIVILNNRNYLFFRILRNMRIMKAWPPALTWTIFRFPVLKLLTTNLAISFGPFWISLIIYNRSTGFRAVVRRRNVAWCSVEFFAALMVLAKYNTASYFGFVMTFFRAKWMIASIFVKNKISSLRQELFAAKITSDFYPW